MGQAGCVAALQGAGAQCWDAAQGVEDVGCWATVLGCSAGG